MGKWNSVDVSILSTVTPLTDFRFLIRWGNITYIHQGWCLRILNTLLVSSNSSYWNISLIFITDIKIFVNKILQADIWWQIKNDISHLCVSGDLNKMQYLNGGVIKSPKRCLETYCFCSVSYYYITPTVVGWCIAILRFFFTIIIIIIILILLIIIIIPHIFVRSISRRCLDQTLWNLVGIPYAMWSCAV